MGIRLSIARGLDHAAPFPKTISDLHGISLTDAMPMRQNCSLVTQWVLAFVGGLTTELHSGCGNDLLST